MKPTDGTPPAMIDLTTLHPMLMRRCLGSVSLTESQFPEEWHRLLDAIGRPIFRQDQPPEAKFLTDYDDRQYAQAAMLARMHRDSDSAEFFDCEIEALATGQLGLGPWGGAKMLLGQVRLASGDVYLVRDLGGPAGLSLRRWDQDRGAWSERDTKLPDIHAAYSFLRKTQEAGLQAARCRPPVQL